MRRIVAYAVVEDDPPGQFCQGPRIEAVALIAVRIAPLAVQPRGIDIAKGEGIALVVVIGPIPRQRVVDLKLQSLPNIVPQPKADPVVARLSRALHHRQIVDAIVSICTQARGPRRAEDRVVAVDEARQAVRARVRIAEGADQALRVQLAFHAHMRAEGARVFEVFVNDRDVRAKGIALGRGQQVAVRRGRAQNRRERAGSENGLPARAIGRARAGQVQARDARVVNANAGAQQGLVVPVDVVGHANAGLEHRPVRGDFAIGREGVRPRLVARCFADEIGEEDFGGIGEHIRLNLRLPAQAVIERQLVRNSPTVLHKRGQLVLWDGLCARFLHC